MAANPSPPETKDGKNDKPPLTFPKTVIAGAGRTASFFSASIYRVPGQLRKLKESAYTPLLVSIGPFHKDLENPQARDLKMWYVNSFVGRMAVGLQDSKSITARKLDELKKCEEEMTKDLDRAKKHYAEEVGDKLTAEMLVVDGCFILEILCRYKAGNTSNNKTNGGEEISIEQPTDDPIFNSPLISNTVQKDLLLLENEIPFFVLEKLFSLTLGPITNLPPSVLIPDYIIPYFHNVMVPDRCKSADTGAKICCCLPKDCVVSIVFGRTNSKKKEPKPTEETKRVNDHILQILHDHNLPQKRKGNREFVSCASELEYSGVKFLAGSRQDLSKIDFYEEEGLRLSWFRPAKFTIPQLSIYDTTEPVLRNLIAFEQCRPNASRYFTSYAVLMDMLVSSEKDVEVLEKANVIQDNLGSKKDVCDLLNNITKEIVLGDFFFAETCKSARDYSNGEWSKFMAQLRRTWFASPWTVIAFFVAGLAFGISITQFIRSFLK